MKLYELTRGARFRLAERPDVPPASIDPILEGIYFFQGVDGMYAKVDDEGNNRHYFAAWTDVEPVDET